MGLTSLMVQESMRGAVLFCLLLAAGPAFGGLRHRPMDEMHGGCASFQMDLRREMEVLGRAAQRLAAWPTQRHHASQLAVWSPVTITLLPFDQAALSAVPKRPGAYAGLIPFVVRKSGQYRISAGTPVWVEVIANGHRVQPVEFEMQSQCAVLFKTVVYALAADVPYWLELSGVTQDVRILLSEHREA